MWALESQFAIGFLVDHGSGQMERLAVDVDDFKFRIHRFPFWAGEPNLVFDSRRRKTRPNARVSYPVIALSMESFQRTWRARPPLYDNVLYHTVGTETQGNVLFGRSCPVDGMLLLSGKTTSCGNLLPEVQ